MAKKNKEDPTAEVVDEQLNATQLSKMLVRQFNKDEDKTGKIAWNLATDLDNPTEVKEFISTGSTLLDYIISNRRNGGVPVGKLTEISGEEASGKSLLCAHLAREVQHRGGIVIYIDTENAMNPDFCEQLGVDLNKMVYLQPGTCEEVGEQIEKTILMTRQKAPNKLVLIIWDSIAGTPTQAEIAGEFELNMNQQLEKSKVLSKMMRKITELIGKERICLVFTNQLKVKIGTMYGDPMTTPGGKAVPYHASVRVRLTRGNTAANMNGDKKDDSDGDEDSAVGVNTSAKIVKNRMGPPLRKVKFFISFANGVEDVDSWFNFLHERGIAERQGGYCKLPEFNTFVAPLIAKDIEDLNKRADVDQKTKSELLAPLKTFSAKLASEKGWQWRRGEWSTLVDETPYLRKWIEDKLETLLIVKYGQRALDAEADPESLMEVEQIVGDLINPQ